MPALPAGLELIMQVYVLSCDGINLGVYQSYDAAEYAVRENVGPFERSTEDHTSYLVCGDKVYIIEEFECSDEFRIF